MVQVRESEERDFSRGRRYSATNCGLTRGYRVWDAALQVYVLDGRRFKNRREAEEAAASLEAGRERMDIHHYAVWQDVPRDHRPVGALWMRPEVPPTYQFKSEAEALAFVERQPSPETWRVYHSVSEW